MANQAYRNLMSESLRDFAKKAYANHDAAHDLNHAYKVLHNARKIAAAEHMILDPTESRIFDAVMLCHDVRDHKLIAANRALSWQECHDYYVAEFGEDLAATIEHIHDNCSWSKRQTSIAAPKCERLRLLLQDADWMEAVGETGLSRCLQYNAEIGSDIPGAIIAHIHEKLLIVYDHWNYASTAELAEPKDALYAYIAAH